MSRSAVPMHHRFASRRSARLSVGVAIPAFTLSSLAMPATAASAATPDPVPAAPATSTIAAAATTGEDIAPPEAVPPELHAPTAPSPWRVQAGRVQVKWCIEVGNIFNTEKQCQAVRLISRVNEPNRLFAYQFGTWSVNCDEFDDPSTTLDYIKLKSDGDEVFKGYKGAKTNKNCVWWSEVLDDPVPVKVTTKKSTTGRMVIQHDRVRVEGKLTPDNRNVLTSVKLCRPDSSDWCTATWLS